MNTEHFKYLFGPVPSRRFGLSLGVDLVPRKTCTLNCVFCEVGPTTGLTIDRKEYVPASAVERELTAWRAAGGKADVITVTGSGEPTLHTGFGKILAFIKNKIRMKSVLLTNSTLLCLPEVRRSAALADIVKVTLSAWDENSFRKITRPHPDVRFAPVVEGLQLFRREYSGTIWLEVFIVPGINSELKQIKAIAELARSIRPDKIQLNTAVRPTAESGVGIVSADYLYKVSGMFEPRAEVIARYAAIDFVRQSPDQGMIQAMVNRRPCTAKDIAAAFSLDTNATGEILRQMQSAGLIRAEERQGEIFYSGAH